MPHGTPSFTRTSVKALRSSAAVLLAFSARSSSRTSVSAATAAAADSGGAHQIAEIGQALRHAGRRCAVKVRIGARRHIVMPTMEVAGETHDLVLAGVGTREPDRHVRGLGARGREAHFLGAGRELA